MDLSRRTLILYLTYLLFLFMMTSSITAGHTVTSTSWNHPSTAYTGVAACALVFGVLFGVAGLIMTITGANDANIAPAEVLEAELGEVVRRYSTSSDRCSSEWAWLPSSPAFPCACTPDIRRGEVKPPEQPPTGAMKTAKIRPDTHRSGPPVDKMLRGGIRIAKISFSILPNASGTQAVGPFSTTLKSTSNIPAKELFISLSTSPWFIVI